MAVKPLLINNLTKWFAADPSIRATRSLEQLYGEQSIRHGLPRLLAFVGGPLLPAIDL